MGEREGHPFRGNQWVEGESGDVYDKLLGFDKLPFDKLSKSQLGRVGLYMHSGASKINAELRRTGGKATSDMIEAMDAALKSAPPLPKDITVFRGMTGTTQSAFGADDVIGKTFTEHGFMSTTVNPKIAARFADWQETNDRIVLELRVPKGTRVLKIEQDPDNPTDLAINERELVLPRGQKFHVTSVERVGKYVHVKAVAK